MLDVMCYSHMLYCAGPRFAFTILDDLVSTLITVHHMPMVKSLWFRMVGKRLPSFSETRWELVKRLASGLCPLLDRFIAKWIESDIGDSNTSKMQTLLADPINFHGLELSFVNFGLKSRRRENQDGTQYCNGQEMWIKKSEELESRGNSWHTNLQNERLLF
ncbi:MAG: hypothetical protein SGPRY_007752 [Prymnesium sp.]